jgi:hypothetical protein
MKKNIKNKTIFTMGGKGGVGKTTVLEGMINWYILNGIPFALLDLDSENKADGSLSHFYPKLAEKADINTRAGLDILIDRSIRAPITLADMGSGSGRVTYQWFDEMYPLVAPLVSFVGIGVVTSDPASVKSVLGWAGALGNKIDTYLIVLNAGDQEHPDFRYWEKSKEAQEFREKLPFRTITIGSRIARIQDALRNHGATLSSVADREVILPELDELSSVMRVQLYREEMITACNDNKDIMLP